MGAGFLCATGEDRGGHGLRQRWLGQLSTPAPHSRARGTSCPRVSSGSQSCLLSEREASWPVLGWSLNAARLPRPRTDGCSYKKALKDKPNFL